MVQIVKSNCPACGAPLAIPQNLDRVNCANCGSAVIIEFGEGYYTLKSAEKIAEAIEQTNTDTRNAIRENTDRTKSELQRLQNTQELTSIQLQLSNLESEIRMLERDPKNSKAKKQLDSLRKSEFELMDRTRVLKEHISPSANEDLKECIEFMEWETEWIESEISVLYQCKVAQKHQISKDLNALRLQLNEKLVELKLVNLKNQFPSFGIPDPSPNDQGRIAEVIYLLKIDEQKLRKIRYLPEARIANNEIAKRRDALSSNWHNLEMSRIRGTLSSLRCESDPNNLDSLQNHRMLIDQDLQKVQGLRGNSAANVMESRLCNERKQIDRQIRYLKRNSKPAVSRRSLAPIFAGIAALFIGAAAQKSQNSSQPTGSGSSEEFKSNGESLKIADADAEDSMKTKGGFGSVVKAALLGFLVFAGISIAGLITYGLAFSNSEEAKSFGVGVFLIGVTAGFSLGSLFFLRRFAAQITIRQFGRLRDIVISPKTGSYGTENSAAVKTIIAISACIFVYLVFITLSMLVIDSSVAAGSILILIGLPLGPLAAWLAVKRTTISV